MDDTLWNLEDVNDLIVVGCGKDREEMSRLIDANLLLQEFETESVANNSDLWHITGIKAFIENAPTAFDTEKVIEQLETIESTFFKCGSYNVAIGIEKSIDIVKKGGVEYYVPELTEKEKLLPQVIVKECGREFHFSYGVLVAIF